MDSQTHVGFKLPNCGGVLCPPEWARPDTILELASLAQEHSYDSLWLHDHLLTPAELQALSAPHFYEPLVVMAAVAGAIPDATIGVATLILPLREPVLLLKQMVTMEHFFPGRIIFGVGVGQYESEFDAFGGPTFRERGRITNEYLELMRALSSGRATTFKGVHRSVNNAETDPKVRFGTEPPIWVGGNSEAALRRALRYGTGWICSTALSPADVSERLASAKAPKASFRAVLTATVANDADAGATRSDGHGMHQHSSVIAGDARSVASRIAAYQNAGITHFLLTFRSGDLDALRAQMRWFAAEVRPRLAERPVEGFVGGER